MNTQSVTGGELNISFRLEVYFPREIKQIVSIEKAVEEGYIPIKTRVHPIGTKRWVAFGIDEEKNTCKGYSASLKLDELDVPSSADAYVASGLEYEDSRQDIPRQMLVNFLYFKKKK